MLVSLAIQDLAIIDAAQLELGPGLNVLTGQTGAGKSIIVGALGLVLGDRANTETIRRGAARAEVQALFRTRRDSGPAIRLRELDLLDDDEADSELVEVVVRRIVAGGGKGRVYVNGRLTTVANLAHVTRGLVDISGQHQHTDLLDPTRHLDVLDRFGGVVGERHAYDAAFAAAREARAAVRALEATERERLQREDFVRFQLGEIDTLSPTPGEPVELERERQRLAHADQLSTGANTVARLLAGDRGAVTNQLTQVARELTMLAEVDDELAPLVERVEAANIELSDVSFDIERYGSLLEVDPRRLDATSSRLDALEKLCRKHGGDLEHVLQVAGALRAELDGFESLEIDLKEATARLADADAGARAAADALTARRAEAARGLEARVSEELRSLAMPGAELRVALEPAPSLGPRGGDQCELRIQTNPGEGFVALARAASGGELSRILLALKRTLTHVDPIETAIFDEIDAGTGGAVADIIGMKLAEIAAERQVITITHLAQVAARGDHHLVVEKLTAGDRTTTRVRALDDAERTEEIARMLGGIEITPRIRAHAAELLSAGAAHAVS